MSWPAIAGDPDPIFEAIDRHRKAEAAYIAACKVATEADATRSGILTDNIASLEERAGETGDAAHNHLVKLAAMTPPIAAGCAALLLHIEQHLIAYGHVPIFEGWLRMEESGKTLLGRIAASLNKAR